MAGCRKMGKASLPLQICDVLACLFLVLTLVLASSICKPV